MSAFGRSKRSMGPEGYVQDTILDYLRATGVLAYRMQSGSAMFGGEDGRGRRVNFGMAGMADILAFPMHSGKPFPLWIECKSNVGRQSALQMSFADQVEQHGHVYVIARSVDDVIAAVKTVTL